MADILPGENRYSLKKNINDEWHLFPAQDMGIKCKPLSERSICGEMERSEVVEEKVCLTDERMRKLCFEKGRVVCGTCVSHLYKTLTEEEETIMNS